MAELGLQAVITVPVAMFGWQTEWLWLISQASKAKTQTCDTSRAVWHLCPDKDRMQNIQCEWIFSTCGLPVKLSLVCCGPPAPAR